MTALPTVIAVCGHEAAFGRALDGVLAGSGVVPVAPGRELQAAVGRALRAGPGPVCVVPMTLGRDPELVADTARTLRRPAAEHPGRIALTEPFGSTEHLIGWLRAAAGHSPPAEAEPALLIVAPAADPDADAELFRVARLVRQHGRHGLVEVALAGGDPSPAEGIDRCRRLGAARVRVLPASFVEPGPPGPPDLSHLPELPHQTEVLCGGPLLGRAAVEAVLATRTGAALRKLAAHDDGIAAGSAQHHGHTHSHDDDHDDHNHALDHEHAHPHPHVTDRPLHTAVLHP
ncbi:cobalamin biosynthesis protein CbiX [Streptomyces sp. NBC_01387]|uniref:sirohydrochlorin chelatase n=1 Tax=unclassified Streptomyces TaxID=2593676 RepID=UPI00225BCE27|nr:cobalamin biosynthesis protein CbiX [Streptomyces sp. NBC_01500]MCX4551465.1 cobalamin biosynthesis protein CbiX [Streptomyces sp. NBC_01500]